MCIGNYKKILGRCIIYGYIEVLNMYEFLGVLIFFFKKNFRLYYFLCS